MSKRLDKLISDLEGGWCLTYVEIARVWVFELSKPYGRPRIREQTLRWSRVSDKEQRAVAAIWRALVRGRLEPALRRLRKAA